MKHLVLAVLCLLFSVPIVGQSTTVSGTVTDSGSQAWASGTYSFTLVPNPQYPNLGSYIWTGGTLNTTISGALNGSGAYSRSIPSNSAISPQGSTWLVSFCPLASAPCYQTPATPITGTTQTLNATPPVILINLVNPPGVTTRAYSDSEIAGALVGSQYYNVTTQLQRLCQTVSGNLCTAWISFGTGSGSVTSVTGTAPIVSSGGATPAISCPSCLTSSGISGLTSGQIPVAGSSTTLTSSLALQGTDTAILTSGTISGLAATLCTDSNGGATTSGCTSGGVTSFNSRTGAVTPQTGDYTATNVGLGSVTNDAQTKAAVMPNTAPTAGQVPTGNAGGTAYAPQSFSGDCTLASTGVITCTKTNGNTATFTVASGTATLATSAILSGTCASAVTVAGTGVATTDNIMADFNADPTVSTIGYEPSSAGMLTIIKYPTTNNVNFKVCNNTSASITPGAVTLNWRVVR